MNKTQWFPIETAPKDCEVFDVYAQGARYTDCIFGRCTYSKDFGIIYESYYDYDGAVYELVKEPEYWSRYTAPEANNQWLIRKEQGTKDTYYVAEGTPPDEVLKVYGIVK